MSNITRFSRSTVRAAQRVSSHLQNGRTSARRGFASSHGEIKRSSDTPWLLMATGITVPGVYVLWPTRRRHGGGHHDDHGAEHAKNEEHSGQPEPEAGSGSKDKDGNFAPEATGADAGDKKTTDQSLENQSAKLTDKPESKRVDPTEK